MVEFENSEESPVQSPTATIEDYLWLIFTLQRDHEEVIGARLAELLEVSPPTVTVTLKRMSRDSWVRLDDKKRIMLTPEGEEAARSVMRRHMLVEWLLAKMLNVPWSRLHEEAHKLEHYISQDVEERLMKELDAPRVCPHGNPIPGNESWVSGWVRLADVQVNTPAVIRRVHEHAESRPRLMHFLEENHMLPGKKVTVVEQLPFNQTLTVEVEGERVSLGASTARYVYVEQISR